MMWSSLSKLLPLPRDTLVYCAHEYTQSNAHFAVTVDPNNQALAARKQAIDEARQKVGGLVRAIVMKGLVKYPCGTVQRPAGCFKASLWPCKQAVVKSFSSPCSK
jgi:hypothetical protein